MIIYEVEKKKGIKGSFTGLTKYLTNSKGLESRVGEIKLSNFIADDVNVACIEATATQMMNTRATSDKTLHLIMSFPAGEKPSSDVLKDCEEIVVKKLGMKDYQRLSVVHGDTDNLHVHIVINKIHPKTKNIFEPYQSHKKLAKACIACEDKYNLIRDNHDFIRPSVENRIDKLEIHKGEESLCSAVRRIKDELAGAANWEDFHKILYKNKCGIKIRANGFVFYDYSGIHVKASSVDRSFSKKKLEERFGAFISFDDICGIGVHASQNDNGNVEDKSKSNDREEGSGNQADKDMNNDSEKTESLNDDLNQAEKFDIENEQHDKQEHKADKRKQSEKRPAENLTKTEEKSLWSEYQKIRKDSEDYNRQIKKDIYDYLFKLNKKNFNKIRLQYKIFSMLKIPKFMRSYLNLYLSMKVKRMREEAKAAAKAKLDKMVDSKQSWLSFLKNKAEKGNVDALNILLRRNSHNIRKRSSEYISGNQNFSMLKRLIEKYMKFEKVTSNGNKVYSFKNKTIVVTEGRIYVNSKVWRNGYKFKKSRNSNKYAYTNFDKAKNKRGFKYRDFKDDVNKTEKVYEYVNEEVKKQKSDNYRDRTNFAKMKNRKFMDESMRSYRNNHRNNQEQKRGRTI